MMSNGGSSDMLIMVTVPISKDEDLVFDLLSLVYFYNVKSSQEINRAPSSGTAITNATLSNPPTQYDCGYISCMDNHSDWRNEYSGVFRIILEYKKGTIKYTLNATAFLLNTTDDYGMDDSKFPFGMTAMHIFEHANSLGISMQDVIDYNSFMVWDDQSSSCSFQNSPTYVLEAFDVTILDDGGYFSLNAVSDDWIFFQFKSTGIHNVDFFRQRGTVTFLGWRADVPDNYGLESLRPGRVFHHPHIEHSSGSSSFDKRYAITTINEPVYSGSCDELGYWLDSGYDNFTKEGSSGAPLIDNTHRVIGVNVSGISDCNQLVSKNFAAPFYLIYNNNTIVRDKLGIGSIATTWEPTYTNLPSHCSNCVQDVELGETGVNCGGPCVPCNAVYKSTLIFTNEDAKDPQNQIQYAAGTNILLMNTKIEENLTLVASNEIVFGPNLEISKGIYMKALMAPYSSIIKPTRKCNRGCEQPLQNVIGPITPYKYQENGMVAIDVLCWRKNSNTVIDKTVHITRDGTIELFKTTDFSHTYGEVIYFTLTIYYCDNTSRQRHGFLHAY